MTTGSFVKIIRLFAVCASLIVASALLFAEAVVPGEWNAAVAKEQTCKEKRKACEARCRQRYGEATAAQQTQTSSCYQRTCDKQEQNCEEALKDTAGEKLDVPAPKGRPITPNVIMPGTRPSGGILDTSPSRPPMRGPSGTGVLAPN